MASPASYGGSASAAPASPAMATNSIMGAPPAEMIVVVAWMHVRVADVGEAADDVRARAIAVGGRVVNDEVQSAGKRPSDGHYGPAPHPAGPGRDVPDLPRRPRRRVDYRRVQGAERLARVPRRRADPHQQ